MYISIGHAIHEPTHTYERPGNLPYWTMGLNLRGRSIVEAEGHALISQGVELHLIAPNAAYTTRYDGGGVWESYWAIFAPRRDWERWMHLPRRGPLSKAFSSLQLRDAAVKRRIVGAFKDGYAAMRSPLPQREPLMLNTIERILLLADTINPRAAHARLDPRVRDALDIMASRFDEHLTVADVARMVHLSPSHMAHLFSEQVGSAPMAFLEKQRIRRAQELLITTNAPINQIAREVGIDNAFHFSTRFRKHLGVSPRAYRENPK